LRVSDEQRLGHVNGGWKVALTTLMNERLAVGGTTRPSVDDLRQLAEQVPVDGQPAIAHSSVRERMADWYAQEMGIKYTRFRAMTQLSRGQTPGPESSIGKIVSARLLSQMAEFGAELQGQAGALMDPDASPMQGWFQTAELYAPGMRIAGGTDEILRNIIAERVLSLPGDVRVDKDQAFNAAKG
jgi:alkylation response protein AidB-like acyl-CoA dehydrogenase